MKHICFLLLVFTFFSCKKDEIDTDLSAQVKGTYEVYSVNLSPDILSYPYQGEWIEINVVPLSANKCNSTITFHSRSGSTSVEDTASDIELVKNNDKIELYIGGKKKGFFSQRELEIYVFKDNPTRTHIYYGRK